jgi:phospholipid/cholesterol/gamma-HCH transport system ATP-binding protein
MDHVTVAGEDPHVTALTDVSLALGAGDLLVVVPERLVETVSLYDVASGLIAPDSGRVLFGGRDWHSLGLFGQSAARGRIGRIFEVEGWVSNLSMFENIALSPRHHTLRSDRELRRDILGMFARIGLRDCLEERPHVQARSDLRRAQWVRAFLGTPELLLLNAPLQDIRPEDHAALFGLLGAARARGAAAIWKGRDAASWMGQPGFEGAVLCELKAGRLPEAPARPSEMTNERDGE